MGVSMGGAGGEGDCSFVKFLTTFLSFLNRDTAKFFTFDQDHLYYIKGQDNCSAITLKKSTQPYHQTASQWQQHDLQLRNGWLKWPTHPQGFYWGWGGGERIRPPDSGVSFLQNPCRFSHKMPQKAWPTVSFNPSTLIPVTQRACTLSQNTATTHKIMPKRSYSPNSTANLVITQNCVSRSLRKRLY